MKLSKHLDALKIQECDEFCPLEGLPCGIPTVYDIKRALEQGVVWMCHTNPNTPCSATRAIARANNIKLNLHQQTCIEDADKFFELVGYQ